jgi:hypothetical protein
MSQRNGSGIARQPVGTAPVTISVMLKFSWPTSSQAAALAGVLALSACTPTYDWREVRGKDAPFTALFPAKPATHSRMVNLDGMQLTMTMTMANADGVTFAVGSAKMPDPVKAHAALNVMKNALVNNIGGTITQEKSIAIANSPVPSINIEATGTPSVGGGRPTVLFARFAAKDQWIYQAVVVGRENAMPREAVDTFFTSFRPD